MHNEKQLSCQSHFKIRHENLARVQLSSVNNLSKIKNCITEKNYRGKFCLQLYPERRVSILNLKKHFLSLDLQKRPTKTKRVRINKRSPPNQFLTVIVLEDTLSLEESSSLAPALKSMEWYK